MMARNQLIVLASIVLYGLAAARSAQAHEGAGGPLAVGVGIGAPTALSIELAPVPWTSFEFAIGTPLLNEQDVYAHLVYKVDVLRIAEGPSIVVPLYLGGGGFYRSTDRIDWGMRLPVGLNFDFRRVPIQLFGEGAFELVIASNKTPAPAAGIGGFAGIRFWL
jgi:hypothetical protein